MSDPTYENEAFTWYTSNLELPTQAHIDFVEWWGRHTSIKSLSFALQIYAAETGVNLKPQDFVPF